jgi:short-subunit dehydrogenase
MGTALVTGASSGIGAAFVRRLASQGYDVILVARREDRLKALATETHQCYGIEAEVLVADLACTADVERVEKRIAESEDLELLINNAGFGTKPYRFSETDFGRQLDMISVHVVASVRLMRAALPGMITKGHGAVINVSSVGAFIPLPANATYCATKAFLSVFSKALATELRGTGVKVQVLVPGFVRTEFHDTPEYQQVNIRSQIPKALWMNAETVVTKSLESLRRDQLYCIPGFKNRLAVALGRSGLASLISKVLVTRFRK